jgi:endonuclease III
MPRSRPFPVAELLSRLEAVHGRPRQIARFDPMEELVSCILSQHTTDANSFPTFTRLRERFSDWQDVVDASEDDLVEVIRGAGLANGKARNIRSCLREIAARNGAYILDPLRALPMPEARRWLETLPGVGPKTASIVLCFALGMDAIPVDTHVYRVSWRVGLIPEDVGENKAHDLLLDRVPAGLAFRFHTGLIQHGRKTCRAPLPLCVECPVTDLCNWYRQGGPDRRREEMALGRKARASQARDPQARDPQARDPQARDPQARDPQARDPQARDPQAQGPQARGRGTRKEPGA